MAKLRPAMRAPEFRKLRFANQFSKAVRLTDGRIGLLPQRSNSQESALHGGFIVAGIDAEYPGSYFSAVPARADFGAAPAPAQIATVSGPNFDVSAGSFPSSVSFPAAASSLEFANPWAYGDLVQPVVTSQSATVTVINSSAASTSLQLNIPAVNVNTTINFGESLTSSASAVTWGLRYVALGAWLQRVPWSNLGGPSFTEFVFGYETPAGSVPNSGQAMFSGTAEGTIFASSKTNPSTLNDHIFLAPVSGSASLAVDFASGKISGSLTQMQYLQNSGSGPSNAPWNDISISASVLTGSNKFSGSTGVTSTPDGALTLKGSATGYIDGGFYGPSAENIGAIWSLSDGNKAAIGGITAGR